MVFPFSPVRKKRMREIKLAERERAYSSQQLTKQEKSYSYFSNLHFISTKIKKSVENVYIILNVLIIEGT